MVIVQAVRVERADTAATAVMVVRMKATRQLKGKAAAARVARITTELRQVMAAAWVFLGKEPMAWVLYTRYTATQAQVGQEGYTEAA